MSALELSVKAPDAPCGPPRSWRVYHRALGEISAQSSALAARLERLVTPRRRLRRREGWSSGDRVSLSALMRAESNPLLRERVWTRRSVPERARLSALLLVDLSGSMRGEKAQAAAAAVVLWAGVARRLGAEVGVWGFQDLLVPLLPFSPLHSPARVAAAVEALVGEVEGARPGGHNRPRFNDDGPCLLEASSLLLGRAAELRLLVVVSDGRPDGRRSSSGDLLAAARAVESDPRLRLVALGLGEGTGHVELFYQAARGDVPLGELAGAAGGLLGDHL